MTVTLIVYFEQRKVGQLALNRFAQMEFQYDAAWPTWPGAFPISLSLPLDGSYGAQASHHFFANLLPEGTVREQICRSLGISLGNDFELLRSIGGDCAGALSIIESTEPVPADDPPRYEDVTEETLSQWSINSPHAFSGKTGHNEIRLSLAGAQDKLPVHLAGEQIKIPIGGTPSTHILKFASPYYSHLPENEVFITLLARAVGLAVVDIRLRPTSRHRIAVITRYDRIFAGGRYRRLHQEDFCQALGISPSNKYEKEGGPRLGQCAEIIRRHTAFPLADLQKLLRWTLFNLVVGNADAHGKNMSLLYDDSGTPRLALFYDLVCTRNYKRLSRHLAMSVGGMSDPDLVSTEHLQGLAADIGFRPRVVLAEAKDLIDRIAKQIDTTAADFVHQFGDSPVLDRLSMRVRKQIRRILGRLT